MLFSIGSRTENSFQGHEFKICDVKRNMSDAGLCLYDVKVQMLFDTVWNDLDVALGRFV